MNKKEKIPFQTCSNDCFLKVEKQILTEDENGHGPDMGSLEWRSVIEFKLKVRDDTKCTSG